MVYAVQGEKNSRKIKFNIFKNGTFFDISSTENVLIAYKKPDGHGGMYDVLDNGDSAYEILSTSTNSVTITLAEQVLTTPGDVALVVSLIFGDDVLSTFQIVVNVEENPGIDVAESKDYFSLSVAIDAAIRAISEIRDEITKSTKVVVTQKEDGTYESTHTSKQIQEAYNNGNIVYCVLNDRIFSLFAVAYSLCVFGCAYGSKIYSVSIGMSNYITVKEIEAGSNSGSSSDAVLYTPQELTEKQKAQARENIGVAELAQEIIDKIPTKTSQLENDEGFLTTAPPGLKVTIAQSSSGSYFADTDTDIIQEALFNNQPVVCYWQDQNIILYPSTFQSGGPYIFTSIITTKAYRVVIRDTEDIDCTVTELLCGSGGMETLIDFTSTENATEIIIPVNSEEVVRKLRNASDVHITIKAYQDRDDTTATATGTVTLSMTAGYLHNLLTLSILPHASSSSSYGVADIAIFRNPYLDSNSFGDNVATPAIVVTEQQNKNPIKVLEAVSFKPEHMSASGYFKLSGSHGMASGTRFVLGVRA